MRQSNGNDSAYWRSIGIGKISKEQLPQSIKKLKMNEKLQSR